MEQEKETFQFVEEEIKKEEIETDEAPINHSEKQEEDFVTGLPAWDLNPPYEVVRRVTRS